MAVSIDGFSIREYTSKMRSVDVLKCWPFSTSSSGDVSREDLESCLPPMTVPKFRWWSNELDAVRSDHDDRGKSENQLSDAEISRSESESVKSGKSAGTEEEKLDMVCPVCRVFNAATLTAVNAHIDGCLAQTMREERRQMRMMSLKSKSKVPKKRSIAEIFEVKVEQPRIQTLFKIWPFSKNPDEVSITVTKFRWLSRHLEALRSNQSEGESSRNENESVKSDDGSGREEEKLEMVCPVCRAFNAATVTAVNAHIDGCLAQAMREERRHMRMNLKPKPKAPKKRSIAEILTVAPQIEAKSSELIEIDKEEEEVEEEKSDAGGDSSGSVATAVVSTINIKRNTNKNRKKKKMERRWKKKLKKKRKVEKYSGGTGTLHNEKETLNQNKKKKKNMFNNGLNAKKEDAYKRKVKTPAKSARKLRGTIGNKRVALNDINASAHKKKASLKYVSVEKKQKEVPPVHGILKNPSTHIFGKTSSGCNIQDGIKEKPREVQELISARHVTFSNKDDILGPKKRNSFDEKMFSLSSDGQATSSVKEQSSGSDEEAASLEVNRRDGNIAFNIDRRKEVCPIVESKQFSNTLEQVPIQNFLRPCTNPEKKRHLVEKFESSTKVVSGDNDHLYLFDKGNTTALHCPAYTGIYRPLSAHQAGNISGTNTQVGDSGAYSSTGKFMDNHGDSTYQVAAMNSDASTRTFLQPSSLYSTLYNQASERSLFPSQAYGDNDNSSQTLGYRPLSHMFSTNMMDNSFPFPGWGKGTVRNNCMDENLFGLPLNSQGELINFSSCEKGGMNQSETSSMLRSSSSRLLVNNIAYQSSQEFLSINERHFVQKTLSGDSVYKFPHYPARLGVTELQGSERADIYRRGTDRSSNHFVRPLDSELNLMKYPFVEENQHDQVQNHQRNGMISLKESSDLNSLSSTQPTMRLMGKDVPIGRSIKEVQAQQFEEGDIWADQQSRRRYYSGDAGLENSFSEICSRQDRMSGSPIQMSSENVTRSVKIQSNQALQSTALMNDPEFEFPQPFLDLQPNHVSQNGSVGFSKIASCHSHPIITHAHTSYAVFNRAPHDLPEQFVSGPKLQGVGSHLQVQPATCNYSQPTCLSSGELNDRKKLPLVTKSAFEFPLVHPAFGEHAKTSWFQSSNRSSPPWLLSSTHEGLPGTSSQQISGPSTKSFPHNVWGGSFTTRVNHSAEVLNPPNPLISNCHMKNPRDPALVVQPPLVPPRPAIKSSSTIRSGCRNKIKVTDRVILEDKTTNDRHSCNNTRKRPATNLVGSTKPIKLHNIEVQGNLNDVSGLIQENSSCEFGRTTGAVELDPHGDSTRSKCCCLHEAQNIKSKSYLGLESSNLDGMAISGPVRLSPGAKHILKPSPNVDQDNSRPIHSAIPIAGTTDTDRDLDIQRKLTKVYKF